MKRIRRGRGFPGGIVLPKDPAWKAPIEAVPIPEGVAVPLRDREGRDLIPAVQPGREVSAGDPLTEGRIPMLAPITGTVAGVEPHPHLTGFQVPTIRIRRTSGEERFEPAQAWRRMGQQDLIQYAWRKGISLPFIPEREVGALVVRAFYDDPHSAGVHRLVLESPESLRLGLEILQHIYVCQRAFLVAEARPLPVFYSWKKVIQSANNLVLVKASGAYPLAEEELMFSSALPRRTLAELAGGSAEALVVEAEAAYDLARAVSSGFPAIEALVTITGSGIPAPRNLRVRVGTPLSALLVGCRVVAESLGKVVAGDALRGWAQFDERTGIGREAHSVILTKREEVEVLSEEPCLRCGWCLEVCPHDLNPARLYEACRSESWEDVAAYGLGECSQCGSCAWTCPSHLKLVHWFEFAKRELSKHGQGADRTRAA